MNHLISHPNTAASINNPSQNKIQNNHNFGQEYSENLTISIDPKGGLYGTPKLVKLTLNEPGTIYYTINGSDPTTLGIKYTDRIYIGKSSTLKYYAVDSKGNATPIYTETYKIDTTQPYVKISSKGGSYNQDKTIYLKADKLCTIYYTLNGRMPTTSSLIYNGSILIKKSTILNYFAVDLAGNPSTVYTQKYIIDKIPPKVKKVFAKKIGQKTDQLTVTFSKKIQLGNYKIYVKNLSTGKMVKITKKLTLNGLIIIINKKNTIKQLYQLYLLNGAIKDLAGNILSAFNYKYSI
jgi:hypothetical protein